MLVPEDKSNEPVDIKKNSTDVNTNGLEPMGFLEFSQDYDSQSNTTEAVRGTELRWSRPIEEPSQTHVFILKLREAIEKNRSGIKVDYSVRIATLTGILFNEGLIKHYRVVSKQKNRKNAKEPFEKHLEIYFNSASIMLVWLRLRLVKGSRPMGPRAMRNLKHALDDQGDYKPYLTVMTTYLGNLSIEECIRKNVAGNILFFLEMNRF